MLHNLIEQYILIRYNIVFLLFGYHLRIVVLTGIDGQLSF